MCGPNQPVIGQSVQHSGSLFPIVMIRCKLQQQVCLYWTPPKVSRKKSSKKPHLKMMLLYFLAQGFPNCGTHIPGGMQDIVVGYAGETV